MSTEEGSIAFWVLFVVTLVGSFIMLAMEDAEGAGTPYWEPFASDIDENPYWGVPQVQTAARGPNNIVYRAWVDDDYAIKVSYTSTNGTPEPWAASTVINSAWRGHDECRLGGLIVLANNTTVVHFTAKNADNVYNAYLAFRWEWSGAWEFVTIFDSGATEWTYPRMALNETHLLMTYYRTVTLATKTFRLSDWDLQPPMANSPATWMTGQVPVWQSAITINQSGLFVLAVNTWSGSAYRYWIQDFDKIESGIYVAMWSGVVNPQAVSFHCTSEDTFVLTCGMTYLTNSGFYTWYETVPWGAFTRNKLYYDTTPKTTTSLGSSIDDDDRVTYYWANDTGVGGGVEISKVTADYQASEATWAANIVPAVYDYGTDDDDWVAFGWYNGRYPIVGGYSVNIPDAGWMGQHCWKDEVGSPDNYAWALYWNATFHWYSWAAPDPDDDGGGGGSNWAGDDGGPWQIGLIYMGDLWTMFIVTATFVGLATAYRKYSDQYTGFTYAKKRWNQYRKPIYSGFRKRKPRAAQRVRKFRY